jgi:hypothetical protein
MPDKTHGELIRELSNLVHTLNERVDHLRGDLGRVEANHTKTAEAYAGLSTQLALLEQQVGDLRKASEEGGRRWWSLLPALVGALIGGTLTVLGQLLLSYFRN